MRKWRPDQEAEKFGLSGANPSAFDPDHRLDDGLGDILADRRRTARLGEPGHLFMSGSATFPRNPAKFLCSCMRLCEETALERANVPE